MLNKFVMKEDFQVEQLEWLISLIKSQLGAVI